MRSCVTNAGDFLQMALMKHRGLFELLEKDGRHLLDTSFQPSGRMPENIHGDAASVSTRLAIETMLEELAPNLWEDDLDRLVDFGHIISPELEMVLHIRTQTKTAHCVSDLNYSNNWSYSFLWYRKYFLRFFMERRWTLTWLSWSMWLTKGAFWQKRRKDVSLCVCGA